MNMGYEVSLDIFQGPLDLLLHLIEENEVDISNIPIAFITDRYLEYLTTMEILNLESVGDFLVMAATLMQIKAKMLLPQTGAELLAEMADESDPRWELAYKLVEYKKIRAAAQGLETLENQQFKVYPRSSGDFADLKLAPEGNPLKNLSIWDLMDAFRVILESAIETPFEQIPRQEISVKQRMTEVLDLLKQELRVSFRNVFTGVKTKIGLITCFLAILELIRMHQIIVFQERVFEDIYLALPEKVGHTA
jgi:segregation and condensation protein A